MRKVRCDEDLGVADCDLVAQGETPGEVVGDIVEHLRKEHDMDMPNADAILRGAVDETDVDAEVWTVIKRLREALNISNVSAQGEELPGEEGPAPVSPEPV